MWKPTHNNNKEGVNSFLIPVIKTYFCCCRTGMFKEKALLREQRVLQKRLQAENLLFFPLCDL